MRTQQAQDHTSALPQGSVVIAPSSAAQLDQADQAGHAPELMKHPAVPGHAVGPLAAAPEPSEPGSTAATQLLAAALPAGHSAQALASLASLASPNPLVCPGPRSKV